MTYFAGVVLHNQIAVLADRRFIHSFHLWGMDINFLFDPDRPKWEGNALPERTFFISSGNGAPATDFLDMAIRDLAARDFTVSDLRSLKKGFTKTGSLIWSKREPEIFDLYVNKMKLPPESVNCEMLFGGLDSEGSPFLMIFESWNSFDGNILIYPGEFYALQEEPERQKEVKKLVRVFLRRIKDTLKGGLLGTGMESLSVSGEGELLERELAKEMLPEIITFVSKYNKYVSPRGDMLIIHRGGREVFGFNVEDCIKGIRIDSVHGEPFKMPSGSV